MLVNLTDVFTNEGQVQERTVSYDADTFTSQSGTFSIKESSPVALRLSNIGQSKALVQGTAKLTFALACDRCLQDVDYTFDLSFDTVVISPDYTGEDAEEEAASELLDGYHLNVDELIKNELLLNWPMKVLCREDCKGHHGPGAVRGQAGQRSRDDFVPDPRMAAIKDLFDANKEV